MDNFSIWLVPIEKDKEYLDNLIKELENIIRAYGKDINNLESKIQELKNTRPQKGKDYFTEIEVKEIIKRVTYLVKPKKPDEEKIINNYYRPTNYGEYFCGKWWF